MLSEQLLNLHAMKAAHTERKNKPPALGDKIDS
jgi:hypothetical protein